MWIMEVDTVPYELQFRCRERLSVTQFEFLHRRSSSIYAVGSGRKLHFVLGVLSPTLLSDTVYMWLMFLEDTKLSLSEVRLLKKVFPAIVHLHGRRVAAEVYAGKTTNDKFLKFLGFTQVRETTERTIYEWS